MAKFVRIRAELFSGIAYWRDGEYYEAGPGHVHVTEDHRYYAEHIGPGAETSLQGVFVRPSGEHAEIWFPCPDKVTFLSDGPVLASVHEHARGFDVYLQPTLGFFFGETGGVFALSGEGVMSALSHKVPVGTYASLDAARTAVAVHAQPYRRVSW